mgnify:CR=1 FL=1
MEQRTLEWHEARKGKFTASEIYKLMGVRGLGETGKTYAIDKAIEELYGDMEENFVSYDMERGTELEPLAFSKFSEIMDLDFILVNTCGFIDICENSGASPDGIVQENDILEIKCPKSSGFFKLVATNEIKDQYLYQMQMQMLATGGQKAYFFNYMIHEGLEYYHTITINRDDSVIDLMQQRISEAVKIKNEYINKIKNNRQWK